MNNESRILIEISQEDLAVSKLLFNNEMFPQSLFYFQQSTEKLTKYIGLKDEIIDKKDLHKKIGHNSSLIFRKAIDKYQNHFPQNIDLDFNQSFQEIRNIIENNLSKEVMHAILKQINDTINNVPELPFDFNSIETVQDLQKIALKINPENSYLENLNEIKNEHLLKPLMDKMIVDFKHKLLDYTRGIIVLFIINTVVIKLVTAVRYPEIENMINPSRIYNKKHPFVEFLPNLQKALQFCIEVIEKN